MQNQLEVSYLPNLLLNYVSMPLGVSEVSESTSNHKLFLYHLKTSQHWL